MNSRKFLFAVFLCLSSLVYGESVLDIPTPKSYVIDFAGVLSEAEELALERKILAFDRETSTQIVIVCLESLEGYDAGDLAQRLAQKWGVGRATKDNGVLILVKPKYSKEKGRVYITVGYGLEHVIPDVVAKRMVEQSLIPAFRKEQYYYGLDEVIDGIESLTSGVYINQYAPVYERDYFFILLGIIIGSFILLPFAYLAYVKRRKVSKKYDCYYVHGAYNLENIFSQIDLMEVEFGRSYTRFRSYIKKYDYISRKNLQKYSGKIDKNMFCYLLDGRDRKKVFWEMSDPFLKGMALYLILVMIGICLYLLIDINDTAFFVGLAVSFCVLYGMFNFLISFLEMKQFVMRSKAKYLGGITVSLFALNALLKRSISKKYSASSGSWVYSPIITYSSGGGGFGGIGGGGFGGFGGGGFGGGGAGGSW